MASDLTAIAAVQKQLDDMKCQFSQEAVQTAKATYDAALDDGATAREEAFALGALLIASPEHGDVRRGIEELNGLLLQTYRPTECAFLIACGYYFSGRFKECRETLSRLLLSDPTNDRAAAMLELVRSKVWQDGTRFALFTGAGIAVAVFGYIWLKKWSRGDDGPAVRQYASNYRSSPSSRSSYGYRR